MMILASYLAAATRVLAFQHNADKETSRDHIHIFFFGLDVQADSIRKYLRKYVPSTMDLCVKTRAGKKNDIELTDQGAYNYASRDGILSPVFTKGYTQDELDQLKNCADLNRQEKEKKREETIIYSVKEVIKVDQVYNRLYEQAMLYIPEKDRKEMTLTDWKRWVVMNYFRSGKPAPRTADGNRYAYSLMMMTKYDFENSDQYPPPLQP